MTTTALNAPIFAHKNDDMMNRHGHTPYTKVSQTTAPVCVWSDLTKELDMIRPLRTRERRRALYWKGGY